MTNRRWPLALLAFGAVFLNGAFQYVVPQKQAAIFDEFGLTERTFGYLAAAIAFLSSCLGASAVWVVPRWGLARSCVLGYVILGAGLAGIVCAPGHLLPTVFGLAAAVGMAYLHLANGLIVELAPRRAAMLTNTLHGCNALGKAIGPLLALIGLGWREPFLAVAGLAATLLAVVAFGGGLPEPGSAVAKEDEEAPAGEVLRRPLFWCCGLLFLPIVGMEQVVNFWLPFFLQRRAGLDEEQGRILATTAASVILWVQCIARFAAPAILVWVSPITLLCVCLFGTFGILVGTELNLWHGPAGIAGQVLCGLAFAVPYPTFFAIGCQFFPRHKGLLSIISGIATSVAFITFSALGGIMGELVGLRWTLRLSPVLGMMVLAGALAIWFAGRRAEQARAGGVAAK
jgi:MFS family permease